MEMRSQAKEGESRVTEALAEADQLVRRAEKAGLTILAVESCTAGALGSALAAAEGAGDVFHGGFIVYSKENKTIAVGVPQDLIKTHTAVSAPVAKAMARGGIERGPADLSIAITGVAGPDPDEDGNPVGLTFIAAAHRDGRILVDELHLNGSKEEICSQAMVASLRLCSRLL
jgi:PncC family amidohydrolase